MLSMKFKNVLQQISLKIKVFKIILLLSLIFSYFKVILLKNMFRVTFERKYSVTRKKSQPPASYTWTKICVISAIYCYPF